MWVSIVYVEMKISIEIYLFAFVWEQRICWFSITFYSDENWNTLSLFLRLIGFKIVCFLKVKRLYFDYYAQFYISKNSYFQKTNKHINK